MATIPEEINNRIWLNCRELINIVNAAKSTEYRLFTAYNESQDTIEDLDELARLALDVSNSYQRLTTITIRAATAQPQADNATATMLEETIVYIETRIPAWSRSIEEVVNNWGL
jgi:hypothetical protein